ncbi:rhodanese-like domain-containing protein [Brachyspira aalborgi]|uniref:Rhodanese-like domain-containing protein n=1 Tax=Brachyspira aalborgi TaxID=29522 RepID=A0A5C8GFG5_9SPIR|nr:rhodanese-like domain-containing protein [Brachyspira aalborgi]TXJ37752.1 rhodanese-like domain-containing protein [Brachyspira aalborgi]TXJ60685.1 rhodanese-like domain-containing protein [Brachyspira aalborgi]
MKNIKTIICLFLSILFFTSCKSKQESNQNEESFKNLTVEEVIILLDANPDIIVIDVRTPDEIAQTGAIENSINIDFKASDFKEKISVLDKDKEYILFCKSGNRSGQASKIMAEMGFSNINNLNNAGYEEFSKALSK